MVIKIISLLTLSTCLTAVLSNSAKANMSCSKISQRPYASDQYLEAKKALRLHPPANVEIVSLPFEQPSIEKMRIQNPKNFEDLVRTKKMRMIDADLLQSIKVSKKVRTVFYPFSGYDAKTSKGLFPKAETIIAVDGSPFNRDISQTVMAEIYQTEIAGYFHGTGQSLDIPSVANAILARLFIGNPDIRILNVSALKEKGRSYEGGDTVTHGQIEYDHGPGTPLQRYIHIQTEVSDRVLDLWWYKQLKQNGFDAIILKAATGGFPVYSELLDQDVLQNLIKNQAVFIDGDNTSHWTAQMQAAGAQTRPLHNFFGYGSGKVTFFSIPDL